jgi:molybdopterin-guanine dinucleotide biosynthesis protein A
MSKIQNIPCVIFAGGKSSRMGEDKSLLPFGGYSSLSEFLHVKMSEVFEDVYISCKDSSKFDFDAKFIEDEKISEDSAPTLGLFSTCNVIESEYFFALSVDTPLISKESIEKIISTCSDEDVVLPKTQSGKHPLCALYATRLKETFKDMVEKKDHKLNKMISALHVKIVEFEYEDEFLNLNYKDEYKRAKKLYEEMS